MIRLFPISTQTLNFPPFPPSSIPDGDGIGAQQKDDPMGQNDPDGDANMDGLIADSYDPFNTFNSENLSNPFETSQSLLEKHRAIKARNARVQDSRAQDSAGVSTKDDVSSNGPGFSLRSSLQDNERAANMEKLNMKMADYDLYSDLTASERNKLRRAKKIQKRGGY